MDNLQKPLTDIGLGNTLFLAIYALNPGKLGYRIEENVAVSIVIFLAGGAIFGQIGNKVRQSRRGWLCAATGFQFLLFAAATAIRAFAPKDDIGGPALAVIALTALASAGQITLAVGVGLAELNTTMVTGSLVSNVMMSPRLRSRNALGRCASRGHAGSFPFPPLACNRGIT